LEIKGSSPVIPMLSETSFEVVPDGAINSHCPLDTFIEGQCGIACNLASNGAGLDTQIIAKSVLGVAMGLILPAMHRIYVSKVLRVQCPWISFVPFQTAGRQYLLF
jgi:hypothetical protein